MDRLYPQSIGNIRRQHYPQLKKQIYLDHAGITPYAAPVIRRSAMQLGLPSSLYGNPHSTSPSSSLSTNEISSIRDRTLQFFNADPQHFDLVFVSNATAAIKLVLDLFRDLGSREWQGFWYGYHADSHTSLVGIRELAAPPHCFHNDGEVETWLQNPSGHQADNKGSDQTGLFAYPAQSNMTGRRPPLSWPARLRQSSWSRHKKLFTLLDAAAYAMTTPLDLSDPSASPDFVAVSLYKIFGYPDLGALIVRKSPEVSELVRGRRYFGGGTVDMVTVMQYERYERKRGDLLHEQLEDGTLPIHAILELGIALEVHKELYGDMGRVSQHTALLAKRLYDGMDALKHWNGSPLCTVYNDPGSRYGDAKTQGPTVAFNLKDARGQWISRSDIESLATSSHIHLRTGGLCNPGGVAKHCALSDDEIRRNYTDFGVRCGNKIDVVDGKPTGVVRVSLGAMSTNADVNAFLNFLRDHFRETHDRATSETTPLRAADGKVASHSLDGALDLEESNSQQPSLVDTRSEVHRCPVWDCSAEYMSARELERHLPRHRGKQTSRLSRRLKGLVCRA